MTAFKPLLIASTLFQIIWFMAVLGRESWQWLSSTIVVLTLVVTALRYPFHWRLWLTLLCIGVGVDLLNIVFHVLVFPTIFFPLWLLALWAMFFWYAQFLTPVLSQYPTWLVSILGGAAGAGSYIAGFKLGAVTLGYSPYVCGVLFFIEWTLLIALILTLSRDKGGKDNDKEILD